MCPLPNSTQDTTYQALLTYTKSLPPEKYLLLDHSLNGRISLQLDAISKTCSRKQNSCTKAYNDKTIKKENYRLQQQSSPRISKRDLAHRLERNDDDMGRYSCRYNTDKCQQMLDANYKYSSTN